MNFDCSAAYPLSSASRTRNHPQLSFFALGCDGGTCRLALTAMPKRPREHKLEEESLAALKMLLREWVIHDFRRDYGIDVQLEIFEKGGEASGLRCYGQLKATDKDQAKDSLRLDRDHLEYWSSHTDPVLILRYFAGSKEFRWCWLHEVAWRLKPAVDSIQVAPFLRRFDPSSTPSQIERFVRLRRDTLLRPSSPPYLINVMPASKVDESVRNAVSTLRSTIRSSGFEVVLNAGAPAHFDVALDHRRISSSFMGLPGYVLDIEPGAPALDSIMAMLVFLTACKSDQVAIARKILAAIPEALSRAAVGVLELPFIQFTLYSLGIKEGIRTLTGLLDDSSLFGNLFIAGSLARTRYGMEDEWLAQLRDWDAAPPANQNPGSMSYNLGNALQNSGLWEEAVIAYQRAATRDASYLQRPYFHAELAASLFEAGQYMEAAESYRAAYALKPDVDLHWRRGDALFHSGQFEEALRELDDWAKESGVEREKENAREDQPIRDAYQILLHSLVRVLLQEWCVPKVVTEVEAGNAVHEQLKKMPLVAEEAECRRILAPFIRAAPLDPTLMFNAGLYAHRCGVDELAVNCFLASALRNRQDAVAWINATASAIKAKNATLVMLLVTAAYFYIGEDLIEGLFKTLRIDRAADDSPAGMMRAELAQMIRDMRIKKDRGLTVRLHSDDGTRTLEIENSKEKRP